jgi:hypothetical protein
MMNALPAQAADMNRLARTIDRSDTGQMRRDAADAALEYAEEVKRKEEAAKAAKAAFKALYAGRPLPRPDRAATLSLAQCRAVRGTLVADDRIVTNVRESKAAEKAAMGVLFLNSKLVKTVAGYRAELQRVLAAIAAIPPTSSSSAGVTWLPDDEAIWVPNAAVAAAVDAVADAGGDGDESDGDGEGAESVAGDDSPSSLASSTTTSSSSSVALPAAMEIDTTAVDEQRIRGLLQQYGLLGGRTIRAATLLQLGAAMQVPGIDSVATSAARVIRQLIIDFDDSQSASSSAAATDSASSAAADLPGDAAAMSDDTDAAAESSSSARSKRRR